MKTREAKLGHPIALSGWHLALSLALGLCLGGCDSKTEAKSHNNESRPCCTAQDTLAAEAKSIKEKALLAKAGTPDSLPAPAEPERVTWSGKGCSRSSCHSGIEAIRSLDSEMMRQIMKLGSNAGDPDGCVVCHGGDLEAETAEEAHSGSPEYFLGGERGPREFYPDPSSPWVNEHSCGPCHEELVAAQWSNLMMTEAGKIQGTAWSFGAQTGYEHTWGNYNYENPSDPIARLGTEAYRKYMAVKTKKNPQVHVKSHERLPPALAADELHRLKEEPELAAFTYLRAECQRCHLGVKGRQRRGDYRGMGCGACHLPYGNEGFYEGKDESIPKNEGGHPLVHSLQGTRSAKVSVHGKTYSGIPVETCSTCHNRGKRIGVSYQGLMESAYGSPFTEGGGGQLGLHSKHYISMQQDIHYQKGMLCQDCHTSGDVHGDRFLAAANLAAVEIECTDCHGTPQAFPWELPLGYGDEDGPGPAKGPARGVAKEVPKHIQKTFDKNATLGDLLLSARGNPLPDVERRGDLIIVHSASGKDLELSPLRKKLLEGSLSNEAMTAMVHVDKHIDTMECYTCHSSWAPQCYGCHVQVDYSESKTSFDWVMAGQMHKDPVYAADRGESHFEGADIPGQVQETRSYLRWENPVLGNNGEGRVTPLIPGCQTSVTVVGPDGETLTKNRIFRATPGEEGAGKEGQLGSDMSPVHPHTVGKSRSCESCHTSDKALGYGIGGLAPANKKRVIDLSTPDGDILSKHAQTQIEEVEGLTDWSAVVTRDGKQLQTVGHHLKGSGPLTNRQRANMDRRGICVSCHQEIPDADPAFQALHHAAKMAGQLPNTRQEHSDLVNKIVRLSAWTQIAIPGISAFSLLGGAALWWFKRRRRGAAKNRE